MSQLGIYVFNEPVFILLTILRYYAQLFSVKICSLDCMVSFIKCAKLEDVTISFVMMF